MLRRTFLVLSAAAALPAADKPEWRKATVLHAEYKADNVITGVAPAGGMTAAVFRGEFDFDAGETVYSGRESVAHNARLNLRAGDQVLLAVEKKTLRIRLPNGKERKLRLADSWLKTTR